jgi:hypothetical protein
MLKLATVIALSFLVACVGDDDPPADMPDATLSPDASPDATPPDATPPEPARELFEAECRRTAACSLLEGEALERQVAACLNAQLGVHCRSTDCYAAVSDETAEAAAECVAFYLEVAHEADVENNRDRCDDDAPGCGTLFRRDPGAFAP